MMLKPTALAAALLLAGCGPLVQIGGGGEPPSSLLTIGADAAPPQQTRGGPILVALPDVPGKLRTVRLPVATQTNELAYLARATWIEQPNQLFRRVLADTISARTGRPVIDEGNAAISPDLRLSGRLLEFGLDVTGTPEVIVSYDAALLGGSGQLIGTRRFERRAPVDGQTGPIVAAALNNAANAVAADIAEWVTATNPS